MIRTLVSLLARSLVELALVLVAVALLFLFVAYRLTRRAVTASGDPLDELAGKIGTALRVAGMLRARAGGVQSAAPEDAPEPEPELVAVAHDEWERMVV